MPEKKINLKHGEDYYIKALLKKVSLKEIMTSPTISVKIDTNFSQVPKVMREHRIRHLPVVDDKNILCGLITQRDLFKVQHPRKSLDGTFFYDDESLDDIILGNVMIDTPFFMRQEDSVGNALVKMVEHKYGCIPVVDDAKKLVGIVTQIDILSLAARIYQE